MLPLDDDTIMKIITTGFGHSRPGADTHQLILVRPTTKPTPLGPQPDIAIEMFAIAPVYPDALQAERMIGRTIMAAAISQETRPILAVLITEVVGVWHDPATGGADDRARALLASGHLRDHEKAVELTQLYAAAADGRRYTGRHWLTGPQPGEMHGPYRWAPDTPVEADGWAFADLIRSTVGLREARVLRAVPLV